MNRIGMILRLWFPVFGWCGLIFYFSSIPNLNSGLGFWDLVLRKLAHMAEYFILVFLLYRALEGTFTLKSALLIYIAVVLSLLYAVSDEVHQLFVVSRSGNIGDILVDFIGIMMFTLYQKYLKKR